MTNLKKDITNKKGKQNSGSLLHDKVKVMEESLQSILLMLTNMKGASKEQEAYHTTEPLTYASVVINANTPSNNIALTNLFQKHDKEKRSHNMIIHGAKEIKAETKREQFYKDRGYAIILCAKIERVVTVGKVRRIGREEESKRRPIMVTF